MAIVCQLAKHQAEKVRLLTEKEKLSTLRKVGCNNLENLSAMVELEMKNTEEKCKPTYVQDE